MSIEIRLAREDDLPTVVAISNQAALEGPANFAIEPESVDEWIEAWRSTHERHPWYVALDDQGVAGFAKSSPHRERGAYAWAAEVTVYVRADARHRGVGTALYARLIDTLQRQGYHVLLAGIATPNPASVRLHEGFGFRRIGVFPRIGWKLGCWHDVGYWHLELAGSEHAPVPLHAVHEIESAPVDT
jgi:phosphinothricin acetyltransferase